MIDSGRKVETCRQNGSMLNTNSMAWAILLVIALFSCACIQRTNLRRGLYIKFCNMLNRISMTWVVLSGIQKNCLLYPVTRAWYVTDTNDYHTSCSGVSVIINNHLGPLIVSREAVSWGGMYVISQLFRTSNVTVV